MMKAFMKYSGKYLFIFLMMLIPLKEIPAQIESPSLSFTRGRLWQSVFNGKIGPSFNNWRRIGVGLDWPGFDLSWVNEDLGEAPSYMLTGGMILGCKKSNDSVFVVEDWSISASTVSTEPGAKYKMSKHSFVYKNGENYWLKKNPGSGEEVIESVWEYNVNYSDPYGILRQLPVRVKRTAHQWNGNKREENYIIYDYIITNISAEIKSTLQSVDTSRIHTVVDTLKDFYVMMNYALHTNSRSWSVLFPAEPPGAKNTLFIYDPTNKLMWGRAGDYKETQKVEPDYGLTNSQGMVTPYGLSGEFLAPGFVGLKLIYADANKTGRTTFVNGYGWSAGDKSFDFSGPLLNKNTEESQYDLVKDPSTAPNFGNTPVSPFMQKNRMWSMMSVGPWDILPGDSIRFVIAELVDGADYKYAVDTSAFKQISQDGNRLFISSAKKAQFTFENNFNHPDPPAAPEFTVDFFKGRERFVANLITWDDTYDNYPDPDDGIEDLTGYKIYRSSFLPIGAWDSIGAVYKGTLPNYDAAAHKYSFVDSAVEIGTGYYYALTAFDSGRASWNINPSARFEETGSTGKVPPLESSIYANRKIQRFTTSMPAAEKSDDVVVVPNPFILGEGRSQPGETDRIQFINIPNPCTIRIYTVRGDHVATIEVPEGQGAIASWDQVSDYSQYVESGIYIYHIESQSGSKTGKFAIIR